MADNDFRTTVESLFRGMDNFVTTKTVVGDAIKLDNTIILPLVDVSFGMGAGAFSDGASNSNNGGGGLGAKMSPCAVLVIQNGITKLVNVKNQDTVTKVLDMVPDLVNKFVGGEPAPSVSEEAVAAAKEAAVVVPAEEADAGTAGK